jgi:hypothetical protein
VLVRSAARVGFDSEQVIFYLEGQLGNRRYDTHRETLQDITVESRVLPAGRPGTSTDR